MSALSLGVLLASFGVAGLKLPIVEDCVPACHRLLPHLLVAFARDGDIDCLASFKPVFGDLPCAMAVRGERDLDLIATSPSA